jgi:hypothetical protein
VAAEKEKLVQLVEVSMEKEPQSGEREPPVTVSKRWVDESDWVVLIVAWNYGTVPEEPGTDGLSVTEWEYRHALDGGKKIFVFMAGDPEDPVNRYRCTDEERYDLKDWILKQSSEQIKSLCRFKEDLRSCHADLFANLRMFRERLEKTLREAVDKTLCDAVEIQRIQPGTQLAELIHAVTPAIRDFTRKVTLIANCKQIHDACTSCSSRWSDACGKRCWTVG